MNWLFALLYRLAGWSTHGHVPKDLKKAVVIRKVLIKVSIVLSNIFVVTKLQKTLYIYAYRHKNRKVPQLL